MGQRKIWCSFAVLVLMTALLGVELITSEQFIDILKILLVSFSLANGAEHIGNGIKRAS